MQLASAWCDRHQLCISAGHWSKDRETTRFPVWEAELPKDLCKDCFPKMLPFQKGYQKVEALFQATALASQIRNEVHRECAAVFGSLSKKVAVTGSTEFLSSIGFGFRDCKAQMYAFVITAECQLRFCEAASEVMHISMCDASKEILFAGEFFLCHEAGRYWMCVTNCSGSYRPCEERLQQAQQLFSKLLGDCEVEALEMNNPRIKELTTRHRGDPVHMAHSIHHPERVEERTAAQIKSALVIMGRGHEVEGYAGPRNAPQVLAFPGRSPQQLTRQLTHRRVRTWESTPSDVADSSSNVSEVQAMGQTPLPAQQRSNIAAMCNDNGQVGGFKHSAPSTASTRSTTPSSPRSRNTQYAPLSSVASGCMYVYADPFASFQKPLSALPLPTTQVQRSPGISEAYKHPAAFRSASRSR